MLKSKLRALIPAGVVTIVLAASFIVFPGAGTFASCGSGSTLTANPPSPHQAGGIIVLTATGACGGYGGGGGYGYGANIGTYRFWELDPGSRWSMVQDYSTQNTFNWPTAGLAPGVYNMEVDIKSFDEPNSIGYDVVKNLLYTISPVTQCTTPTFTVTGGTSPTTGGTGGSFVMTGSTTGCPNPVFKFWVQDPGRTWSVVQAYSAVATHTWGPIGTWYLGAYKMEVDVRDASETTSYDAVSNLTFTLTGCTVAGLTAAPPSPSVTGAGDVVLTATSTCPRAATYRFWILDAGGTHWSIVQDFSTTATYTWKAANQRMGTAKIEVDVRDQGSLEVYEAVTQGLTYTYS
jgi:hypothetical protein